MQVQDDVGRDSDFDLRHYLRVIGRRKWLIGLIALLVGLASMGYAFTKEERFRATGAMLLLAPGQVEAQAEGFSDEPDRVIANEIEILGSLEMRQAVADRLGEDAIPVNASTTGDNDVIVLTADSPEPEEAAAAVNTYARTYERIRRQRTVEALRTELRSLQEERRELQASLNGINQPIEALNDQIIATPPGPAQDAVIARRDTLLETVSATRDGTQSALTQVTNEVQDTRRAMQNPTGGVNFLNPATVPDEPFFPQPKKDLYVGLVVGLLLGLAAAFVWEQLDDVVRGRADADRATGGIATLGVIPRVSGWRNRAEPRLVTRDEPRSSAAESYRNLVTSLEFLSQASVAKVVIFTSSGPAEGKTTTVANVGVALAQAGHNTVIVDADLRRPRLHSFFGIENTVGLTTVLGDRVDVVTATVAVEDQPHLSLVPAGPMVPNPAELLRSDLVEAALLKLSETFDIVVIDSPPVLPVADALVLSRHVDAAVLLATADGTSRRKLSRAVEALQQVEAPLRGLVLNSVGAHEGDEYGYYGDDEGPAPKRRRGLRRRSRRH
jgi:capsular exopolysaccharide synthesis family protein